MVAKAFKNIDTFNDKYRISQYVLDQDLATRIMQDKGFSVPLTVNVPKKSILNNALSLTMDGLKTKDIVKLHDILLEKYGGTSGTMIEATIDPLFSIIKPLKNCFRKCSHSIAYHHNGSHIF